MSELPLYVEPEQPWANQEVAPLTEEQLEHVGQILRKQSRFPAEQWHHFVDRIIRDLSNSARGVDIISEATPLDSD